jgi:hypothetical protein
VSWDVPPVSPSLGVVGWAAEELGYTSPEDWPTCCCHCQPA